jgi:hypothetical protein
VQTRDFAIGQFLIELDVTNVAIKVTKVSVVLGGLVVIVFSLNPRFTGSNPA